jgi:hypothetical protein
MKDPKLNFLGFRFCRLDKFLAITIWNIQTTYTFWSLYNSLEFLHISGPLRPLQLVMGIFIGKSWVQSPCFFWFPNIPIQTVSFHNRTWLRFDHPFSTLPKKLIRLHKESLIWNKSQIFCTKCPQLTPFCKVKLNCERGLLIRNNTHSGTRHYFFPTKNWKMCQAWRKLWAMRP